MKKLTINILALITAAAGLTSCHKLDVEATTELTSATFPKSQADFNALMGTVYTTYRNDYSTNHFFISEHTTDAAVLPFYGTDWVDGNSFERLHRHTWTPDHGHIDYEWYYLSNLIGNTNQVLYLLKGADDGDVKNASIAEMRTMRALFYFYMMDEFGGVPLDTAYGDITLKERASRAQVFDFVEKELRASIPFLKTASGVATYGKPNRYMAFSLLAKLYLNAPVYINTPKYAETIAACDSVINAGGGTQYQLESRATYLNMFSPTNGPSYKEFIFAIPFDPTTSNGYLLHARYDLNRNLGMKYRYSGSTMGNNVDPIVNFTTGNGLVNNRPSGPRCTTDEFYAYFNDPNDIRNNQWLTGLQYWNTGNPIMVRTTNLGYNQFYTGANPGQAFTYQLNLTPLGSGTRFGPTSYDLGKDELAWNTGYRNIKFSPDPNSINRNQNNDAPVFRLSDIILMKAEALLRSDPANLTAALVLVNSLRAVRTTTAPLITLTLDDIFAERTREMSWETWHRNDMIRFGKFENTWGLNKTNTDTYRRIFPVPTGARQKNPKLSQNPGY
ncbi:MAG: RagB/SusD family nutrient uptake outer membrane protein [Citrobacter freundii]|nr:MAG: RagB/SusD family nutrient uptake outer membrane protein [Citrobacter freundii]